MVCRSDASWPRIAPRERSNLNVLSTHVTLLPSSEEHCRSGCVEVAQQLLSVLWTIACFRAIHHFLRSHLLRASAMQADRKSCTGHQRGCKKQSVSVGDEDGQTQCRKSDRASGEPARLTRKWNIGPVLELITAASSRRLAGRRSRGKCSPSLTLFLNGVVIHPGSTPQLG